MAQIRVLKISSDGIPLEHSFTDDVTFTSFTVDGGGPVMSGTGIDMNGQDVSDLSDLVFTDPSVGTINQTAGSLIVDNLMAKERSNTLTTAADILFPTVTDSAGQVDIFRLPTIAGAPTATPTTSGEGFLLWDSTGDRLFAWTGSMWDDLSTVTSANHVDNPYTAEVAVAARDIVYISSADNVSPADSSAGATSYAIGFATAAAAPAASVTVRSEGILTGFSGLTAGARYYLSPSTPGASTATVPTGSGNTIVQVGYAKSATAMHIQIAQLGRRA